MERNVSLIKQLEGEWTGRGVGVYPFRVPTFKYEELLTIKPTARPNVWEFRSSTKNAVSGKPMHVEVGFIRTPPNGSIELVVAHPFGLVEISSGRRTSPERMELLASEETLRRADSASPPFTIGLRRIYELSEDRNSLAFTMEMSTSNHPISQNHLMCKLTRNLNQEVYEQNH